MATFKKGLVIGKFYPPHLGHSHLIDTALSQCDEVVVIVCWKKSETISGYQRAKWLKEIHPKASVLAIEDNKLADDDSKGWAEFTLGILGYVPDAVFTSEAYGDAYASFMGSTHILVDKDRTYIPISATEVRRNPRATAHLLHPKVRAYFAQTVCVVGAESTGTTTLSKDLAEHYKTVWVPEYGRMYSEGKLFGDTNAKWRSDEFMVIAKAQAETEDMLAEASNGLVIADTDAFATSIWHERYMGTMLPQLEAFADTRSCDLHIVTGDEIPFVQDGLRDGEHIRHDMHERFIEKLTEKNRKFIVVTGNREDRLKQAIGAIEQLV